MKLNYRDRILLTAVIVILVWVAGIMLFIKPAIEDMGDAQTALDEAKVTLSDLEEQIDADKDLDARIDEAYTAANDIAKKFYDYQEAQVATQTVDTLLDTDGVALTNTNMSISAYTSISLQPYMYSLQAIKTDVDDLVSKYEAEGSTTNETEESVNATDETQNSAPQTIGCYTISFEFKGTIDGVKNFCENLKSNDQKTLILQSIDISYYEESEDENAGKVKVKAGESDFVEGTMSLNMIVLRKLTDPTIE